MQQPTFTLGVEEEYQIVDPQTRALRSHIGRMLEDEAFAALELKPELHQSMVEVGTPVCRTPADVRTELVRLRKAMIDLLAKDGLTIASAGSHPFSHWWDQEITPLERYVGVKQDMGDLAHRLLIFGMHIHVGVEDRELAIDLVNASRYFLPHLLCLSTSSPFWIGRNTGLKSYRSSVFRGFPRTGIPTKMESWGEFEQYIETLVETGSIPNGSKIWWDVRPHYKYPTIEFRICDACTRVDEAVCLAAIVQALAYKLWKLRRDNLSWRDYSSRLIEENKWRAMRFGLSGRLIDFGRRTEQPAPALIRELVEWFLGDVVDELGTRKEVEYVYRILEEGSSADRQLRTYERTGSLEAVVDQLIAETAEGVTGVTEQPADRPAQTEQAGAAVGTGIDGARVAHGRPVPLAVEAATLAAAAAAAPTADGNGRSHPPGPPVAPAPRPDPRPDPDLRPPS
ncbi:carboxylate-amine ligase [Roseisolibacter sp. H3M3-2]|nr:carboxylate-amine ligase [Roseisolibacter sp. H3M3-2]MDF1503479.1 carboxylate-amine ligase [Roseisolibacter sp. H3M3-2]